MSGFAAASDSHSLNLDANEIVKGAPLTWVSLPCSTFLEAWLQPRAQIASTRERHAWKLAQ
jgi:hypothetical protein